jgi:hypothetical protein
MIRHLARHGGNSDSSSKTFPAGKVTMAATKAAPKTVGRGGGASIPQTLWRAGFVFIIISTFPAGKVLIPRL